MNDKELNLEQLDGVNGGTGIHQVDMKLVVPMRQAASAAAASAGQLPGKGEGAGLDPMEGVNSNTSAVECPKCHSIAVKLDMEANSYMCQDCGNIVTLGK